MVDIVRGEHGNSIMAVFVTMPKGKLRGRGNALGNAAAQLAEGIA